MWLAQRALEHRPRWGRWVALIPLAGMLGIVLLAAMVLGIVAANQGNCGTSMPPAPAGSLKAGELVSYFEQAGWSPNAAAGIVGNMAQESGLDPAEAGGGLVQNLGDMLTLQTAYDSQHGLDPGSAAGQLEFLLYWVPQQPWWSSFDGASSPQDAALWFQDGYEHCSGAGAPGTDQEGGGLCNPANRQAQAMAALQAAGGASGGLVLAAVQSPGVCVSVSPGPAGAQKLLAMAQAAQGVPYSTPGHAAAFDMTIAELRASVGTDCSGFASWLMGPQGLGIWTEPLAGTTGSSIAILSSNAFSMTACFSIRVFAILESSEPARTIC